jgi:hypothetical protein
MEHGSSENIHDITEKWEGLPGFGESDGLLGENMAGDPEHRGWGSWEPAGANRLKNVITHFTLCISFVHLDDTVVQRQDSCI